VEHTVDVLIRALASYDQVNDYFVYVTDLHPFAAGELPPNFHLCRHASAAPWAGRLFSLPYYYRRDRLDVLYVQRVAPLLGCSRTVVHVHDAMYATHPHLFPAWKRAVLNPLFRWSGRKAAKVITPTQASRGDIVATYGIRPEKIHVIPDTVDSRELYPESDTAKVDAVAPKYGLKRPYVIFLGAIERNKNVHGAIEAFAQFQRSHPEYHLALVGKWRSETRGGYAEELTFRIAALGLSERIKMTGFVSAEHRRLLLNGASMLVFPSEAEGLGLPPLEAMACGVPVIASDIPSIREYYDDALLLCPPQDLERLAELMGRVATDAGLAAELRRKGLACAARYRWDYKAPLMIDVFRSAVQE
jgi:glycosyltransferase involved in cell wall biosynthesis